jgi:hypothetical protein
LGDGQVPNRHRSEQLEFSRGRGTESLIELTDLALSVDDLCNAIRVVTRKQGAAPEAKSQSLSTSERPALAMSLVASNGVQPRHW